MSTIKIIYTKDTNSINVLQTDLLPNNCELHIGIDKNNLKEVVKFKHLRIQYQLKLDNQIVLEKEFPTPPSKLLSSNQQYLYTGILDYNPDLAYTLEVRIELDDHVCEDIIEIIVPPLPIIPPLPIEGTRLRRSGSE